MKVFENITPEFEEWIKKQPMFFVASASTHGHVNVSPKGHDALRILSNTKVCYMDMSGSGNETSAHLQENGRITIMFCAFEGPPRILRLYGTGRVVLNSNYINNSNNNNNNSNNNNDDDDDNTTTTTREEWNELIGQYDEVLPSTRQIIVVNVQRVQTSCGYAVPFMDYKQDRDTLKNFFRVKVRKGGTAAMEEYWRKKNTTSIDGLPTPLGDQLLLMSSSSSSSSTTTTTTTSSSSSSVMPDSSSF